jgi:Protein of unknown function (DUF2939)
MKRLIAAALLLFVGFYVAWPAWSGYQIHQAVHAGNNGLLESKIDFARVRTSLRPVVTAKIGEGLEKFQAQAGGLGAVLGQLKGDIVPKLVESTLTNVVNSDTIMRVATEGGTVKDAIERIVREQVGKGGGMPSMGGVADKIPGGLGGLAGGLGGLMGGLGKIKGGSPVRDVNPDDNSQPPPGREQAAAKPAAKFSLANIKGFKMHGPLSFAIGVAKDATAAEPDVTAELSFTGGDWKVTGLVPKL